MAEEHYGPKGATLEDLQQQIADLRSEIDRLNPEATDKKRSKLLAAAINEETRPSVGDLRPFPGHGFASAQTRLITVGDAARRRSNSSSQMVRHATFPATRAVWSVRASPLAMLPMRD
jgi:hypothetical protein